MKLRHTKAIVRMILAVALGLLFSINVANAVSLNVSLGLPSAVSLCTPFTIAISVTNNTNSPIIFNKVAVGYLLQDLKIRGPYEVDTSQHTVPANNTITLNVLFSINYFPSSGGIVPLSVILANNNYDKNSMVGAGIGGVKLH